MGKGSPGAAPACEAAAPCRQEAGEGSHRQLPILLRARLCGSLAAASRGAGHAGAVPSLSATGRAAPHVVTPRWTACPTSGCPREPLLGGVSQPGAERCCQEGCPHITQGSPGYGPGPAEQPRPAPPALAAASRQHHAGSARPGRAEEVGRWGGPRGRPGPCEAGQALGAGPAEARAGLGGLGGRRRERDPQGRSGRGARSGPGEGRDPLARPGSAVLFLPAATRPRRCPAARPPVSPRPARPAAARPAPAPGPCRGPAPRPCRGPSLSPPPAALAPRTGTLCPAPPRRDPARPGGCPGPRWRVPRLGCCSLGRVLLARAGALGQAAAARGRPALRARAGARCACRHRPTAPTLPREHCGYPGSVEQLWVQREPPVHFPRCSRWDFGLLRRACAASGNWGWSSPGRHTAGSGWCFLDSLLQGSTWPCRNSVGILGWFGTESLEQGHW